MPDRILVAYASRYGSTLEVAERIAATLREAGLEVDLQSLREVESVEDYDAVVMGAPLFMVRWHKDAFRFLKRHRKALTQLPVAVFALGPFHDDEAEWADVRAQLDKELKKYPWFRPFARQVIGGKYDPQKLGFPWSVMPGVKKLPASDIRDWTAITGWARELAVRFQTKAN